MIGCTSRSTRTYTLVRYTTRCRSHILAVRDGQRDNMGGYRLPDPLHEHFRHFTRRLHTIEHDPEAGFVALHQNLIGKADALRNLVERLPFGFVGEMGRESCWERVCQYV